MWGGGSSYCGLPLNDVMAAEKKDALETHELELFSQVDNEIADACQALYDWGCCPYCTLRFLGQKKLPVYHKSLVAVCNWLESVSGKPWVSETAVVCITCMGLLQSQYCTSQFLNKISEQVHKEGFQFETFTCAVTLPVATLLREHAVWVLLRETHGKMYYGTTKEDMLFLKDVWKTVTGPELVRLLSREEEKRSKFKINMNFIHPDSEKECNFLSNKFPNMFRKRKQQKTEGGLFTRTNVTQAINKMSQGEFQRCYPCPPKPLAEACTCEDMACSMEAVFLAGRYNKFSRELSQTPWIVDGTRKTESSVQELICDRLQKVLQASEYRFSSAGREDVDVKCLGNGRPFLIEFFNAKVIHVTPEELSALQKEINGATHLVAMRDLQMVEREETMLLKLGEMEKIKSYSALCWSPQPIEQQHLDSLLKVKDLVLSQKTPIRVLHRRPLAARDKVIHSVSATKQDEHHFKLSIRTQAGTYIKEFVHGDFGRTTPNLCTLLDMECDILELDVESVELDWPPRLDEQS